MDHEGDAPPPFWFQPPPAALLRQRRRSSSPIFSPVALIILVPILALLLIAFLVIPLVSNASQFLKSPNSLKKGWDSLNIVLVLFAVVCGVFLRQNNDDASVPNETINNPVAAENGTSDQWLDADYDDDQKINVDNSPERLRGGGARMMRSSSSYPDLRQEESLWHRPYRFYDDFDLNIQHSLPLQYSHPHPSQVEEAADDGDSHIKVIPVDDTFVSRSPSSSELLPEQQADEKAPQQLQQPKEDQPPQQQEEEAPQQQQQQPKEDQVQQQEEVPLQQPRPLKLKRRRSIRNPSKKESIKRPSEIDHLDKIDKASSPPQAAAAPPNPPPPPPPPPPLARHQEKSEMLERTKEIATAIASLYNRTKKKKKQKIRNIYDNSNSNATANTSPSPTKSSTIPPPPPPPPPPSVFHNMFKKGNKSKKIHSVSQSVQPPPPPPPPPNSIFNNIFKNTSKSKRFNSTSIPPPPPPLPQSSILNHLFKPATTSKRFISTSVPPPQPQSRRQKPPLPTKTSNYYENIGSQSPVVPIPAPPPPPPFKMRQVKFEARGDFVRIRSAHGSTSPELEDIEVASTSETPRAVDGGGKTGSSAFCPSPDVNTKADNFIARLRDEWRLEKINSIKAKQ